MSILTLFRKRCIDFILVYCLSYLKSHFLESPVEKSVEFVAPSTATADYNLVTKCFTARIMNEE